MKHLPFREESWKKIAYLSRKYTGIRVTMLTWIAVYLFCFHLRRACIAQSHCGRTRRQAAVIMAFSLAVTTTGMPGAIAAAEPDEDALLTEVPEPELTAEIIAQPDEEIPEGYTEQPEFTIALKNSGAEDSVLTGLSLSCDEFELWWEDEDGERYLVCSDEEEHSSESVSDALVEDSELVEDTEASSEVSTEEPSEELSEESSEESTPVMPTELAYGECLTIHALLPVGKQAGKVSDVLRIAAAELSEPVEVELAVTISAVAENPDEEQPTDTPDEEQSTDTPDTENPDEEQPVDTPDTENPDEENISDVPAEDVSEVPEDIAEPEEEEISVREPSVQGCERPSGFFMGSAYFVNGTDAYHFYVQNDAAADIICRYNGKEESLSLENGAYTWAVPQEFDANIEVGYFSAKGEFVTLLSEYVVNEHTAPVINYQQPENENQTLVVNLEDGGKIKSGIDEYQILIDGEQISPEQEDVIETCFLYGEKAVVSKVNLRFRLSCGEHEVQAIVTDYVGNASSLNFKIQVVPQDVISVVLPTTFSLAMLPENSTDQIISSDIVICNRSEFPLDVEISSVEVDVDKTIPQDAARTGVLSTSGGKQTVYTLEEPDKSCDVSLQLQTADEGTQIYHMPEGITDNVTTFALGERREETNSQELQATQYVDNVESDDYAVINFRGMLSSGSKNMWRDGDLQITVVFSFAKQDEK
jgi:hypothetical protein